MILKTISKILIVGMFALSAVAGRSQSADLTLTGNPDKSVYAGFPTAGTFQMTFQNNSNVTVTGGSFSIVVSMPPTFTFESTYPNVPAGWSYAKIDDYDAALTPTADVSGTGTYVSFSVPFKTSGTVNGGSYLAQIVSQTPFFSDPNPNNSTPKGIVSVLNTILPVDFVAFSATVRGCMAQVNWKVANQLNLKEYELQYSTDGTDFRVANLQPANGTGTYGATYPVSGNGIYYFRVKAVDLDGSFKYSATTTAKADCSGEGSFSLFPNPVLKSKPITLSSTTNESTNYQIFDMTGRLIQEGRFTGNTIVRVINGGTYIVHMQSAAATMEFKVIVQ